MKLRETRKKIVSHFEAASIMYSHRKGIVHAEADPIILEYIKQNGPGCVLEVGGGSGYLLDLTAEDGNSSTLINCELAYKTYSKQANPQITLIGGDAISLPFARNTFDYVIIKNVLHHLVGPTHGESKINAGTAATELRRVAKHGGTLFVVEQFHRHRWCAGLYFYFSLLFSIAQIQMIAFGVRRNIIVSFLTPPEIRGLFAGAFSEDFIIDRQISLTPPFPLRAIPFLRQFGRLFIVSRIEK